MQVELEMGRLTFAVSIKTIQGLIDELERQVRKETQWLRHRKNIPHPYDAGVVYHIEEWHRGKRRERWQRIQTTLRRGWGDCEDLSIYLASWIRARMGIRARVALLQFTDGVHSWYHAVVELPSGRILDPSKQLGM